MCSRGGQLDLFALPRESTRDHTVAHFLPRIRRASPEDFPAIRTFLGETNHLYPRIGEWWDKKVVGGLKNGRRVALVLDVGKGIGGLFIGKRGANAKLCTLRLRPAIRNHGLGKTLVREGLKTLLSRNTSRVHVTVSEGAERDCISFFESVGFSRIAAVRDLYAQGLYEFIYSSTSASLAGFVEEGLSLDRLESAKAEWMHLSQSHLAKGYALLMSLKPNYADLFLQGRKCVEFRRRFSKRHVGATAFFYVSSPVRSLAFVAEIGAVNHARTAELWSDYGDGGGVPKETFDSYFRGLEHGYAIEIKCVEPLPDGINLDKVRSRCPDFAPPQSFRMLKPDSPLLEILDDLC